MAIDSHLLSTGLNAGSPTYGEIVGAEGVWFVLGDGQRVIDASNTAGPLGHAHPRMVAAIQQAANEPVVNEGWAWQGRRQAADRLIDAAFGEEADWVGAVRFFLSGSEANDLALSLAQAITGKEALATRERAYHGMTGLAREMTVQPHWHGGLSARRGGVRPAPRLSNVRILPRPTGARIGGEAPVAADELLADATSQLQDVAAVIIDYTQGGTYHSAEYQDKLATAATATKTLWIADEVVTGFGRTSGWFDFQQGESRPDIVTLGKPLSAGAAPGGAIVVSKEVLAELDGQSWQTYSTFRGHPLTIAAICAHLETLQEEQLVGRAQELDPLVFEQLRQLASAHPSIQRIDGRGLHWTIELHGPDWQTWRADVEEPPIATKVAAAAADAGALIGTSGEQTSLFLSPPLIIEERDLIRIFEALDQGLTVADREL